MSQLTRILILLGFFGLIAFGFVYFILIIRKETEKMKARGYKKLKGEKLIMEKLR